MFIHQRDNVSVVGGYQQWRQAGRQAQKGEHGLQIWIPIKGKGREEETPSAEAVEADEEEKPAFIMGTVFDISQTETQDGAADSA